MGLCDWQPNPDVRARRAHKAEQRGREDGAADVVPRDLGAGRGWPSGPVARELSLPLSCSLRGELLGNPWVEVGPWQPGGQRSLNLWFRGLIFKGGKRVLAVNATQVARGWTAQGSSPVGSITACSTADSPRCFSGADSPSQSGVASGGPRLGRCLFSPFCVFENVNWIPTFRDQEISLHKLGF